MKTMLTGVAVLAAVAVPCAAEPRYDVKLEKAVMQLVAKKIGGIRGSFSYDARPEFVRLPEHERADGWKTINAFKAGSAASVRLFSRPGRETSAGPDSPVDGAISSVADF